MVHDAAWRSLATGVGAAALSELLRIPVGRELSDRVRWLIRVRWVALAVAAALVAVVGRLMGDVLPVGSLWATVGALAAYNALFWAAARRSVGREVVPKYHAALMHGQIVADLLALTTALHFSGGIENYFSTSYVVIVAVGSVLMTRRGSYLYAALASLLWVGLLLAESTGLLPHYNLTGFRVPTRYREAAHIITEGLVMTGANLGVAYLASNIMERLREGEEKLYQANLALAARAEQCSQLNERLQELDRVRAFFVRLVTHELRAPVAAIQSYLRLILDGYVPQGRLLEIVGKAEARARDQLELISDLLDLASLQEVQKAAAVEPADAASALRDVLDMMQARIQGKSLSLGVQVTPEACKTVAGEQHLRQLWTNLISNAVKYTPEGGKIAIALVAEDDMVRGSVQDTGIGISPKDRERIFESFYRTQEAKAMSRHGTGLGLSIVKGIAERYGGRVWVESEVGLGSTFFFELPKAE